MNCRYLLSLLVAATCSLNVQAASSDGDRWFDVEILVFKRNVDIQKISEQLDQKNVYLKKREQLDLFKAEQVADCLAGEVCLHKKNPVEITKAQIVNNQRIKLLKSSHWKLKEQLLKLDEHELFKPLITL